MSLDYRITPYNINDFILNYKDVGRSLNKACHRDGHFYRIAGIFQTGTEVIFLLTMAKDKREREYVVAPFPGRDTRSLTGEIQSRWQGGFLALGQIKVNEELLGIFEKLVPPDTD